MKDSYFWWDKLRKDGYKNISDALKDIEKIEKIMFESSKNVLKRKCEIDKCEIIQELSIDYIIVVKINDKDYMIESRYIAKLC